MFYIKKLFYIKKTRAQFPFGNVLKLSLRVSGITKESTSWIYYIQFNMGNVAKLRQTGGSSDLSFHCTYHLEFLFVFCLSEEGGEPGSVLLFLLLLLLLFCKLRLKWIYCFQSFWVVGWSLSSELGKENQWDAVRHGFRSPTHSMWFAQPESRLPPAAVK